MSGIKKRSATDQTIYDEGYRDAIIQAAAAIEQKHIRNGTHDVDHFCRTRAWLLARIGQEETLLGAGLRKRAAK